MSGSPEPARLFLEEDLRLPVLVTFAAGHVAVYSAACPGREGPNEDAAALIPAGEGRGVIAVADGCGGMADGGEAARLAVQALRDEVAEAERLRGAILDAIDRATKRVHALGSGAATTLAAVEIDGDMVRPYHVGDSQVLLVGQRGRIKILTTSHSPVGYALEAGLLSEEEALHHEERHLVSNVVGTPDMHVEMGPRCRMSPRDTLLVGSDGLFDNLLLEEIVELIRRGPLPVVAQRLVETASARMRVPHEDEPSKPDDLTFVVYRRR